MGLGIPYAAALVHPCSGLSLENRYTTLVLYIAIAWTERLLCKTDDRYNASSGVEFLPNALS